MKKIIALFVTLIMLCSLTFAYAGSEDITSSTHTESVTVVNPRGNWAVSIQSSLEGVAEVEAGTEVTLTAVLEGFRDDMDTWTITWQKKEGDGEWEDVGTGETYTFNINKTNVKFKWRIVVHVEW